MHTHLESRQARSALYGMQVLTLFVDMCRAGAQLGDDYGTEQLSPAQAVRNPASASAHQRIPS